MRGKMRKLPNDKITLELSSDGFSIIVGGFEHEGHFFYQRFPCPEIAAWLVTGDDDSELPTGPIPVSRLALEDGRPLNYIDEETVELVESGTILRKVKEHGD
jgi:hypothetical protein